MRAAMVSSPNTGYHRSSVSSAFRQFPNTMEDRDIDLEGMESTSASASSASQGMAVTPERESTPQTSNIRSGDKKDLHVRQNFGKDRGYIPPSTMNDSRLILASPRNRSRLFDGAPGSPPSPVPVAPEHRASDNEMPFDVLNHMIIRERSNNESHHRTPPEPPSPPRASTWTGIPDEDYLSPTSPTTAFDSVWESSPEREGPLNELHPKHGRFSLRPPKLSDPSPLDIMDLEPASEDDDLRDQALRLGMKASEGNKYPLLRQAPKASEYEEFGLSPNSIATDTSLEREVPALEDAPHDEDSIFDFEEETRDVPPQFPDPDHKPVKVTHKIRRRTRYLRKLDAEVKDDTSLENSFKAKRPSPTNLQERAQQAWKSRRQKSSSFKSKQDPQKAKPANVSFGATDTVHHFEPDVEEEDDQTYHSVDDRSLNSDYTKTLESEVEDMIKDILFIGTGGTSKPGRRKIKHKHEVKRKLRKQQKAVTYVPEEPCAEPEKDEDVRAVSKHRVHIKAGTGSSSNAKGDAENVVSQNPGDDSKGGVAPTPRSPGREESNSNTSDKPRSSQNLKVGDEGDPLLAVWRCVEGGVAAVSSALGLSPEEATKDSKKEARKSKNQATRTKAIVADSKEPPTIEKSTCTDQILPFETCTGATTGKTSLVTEPKPGMIEMMDYAQDYWYGPIEGESDSFGNSGSNSKESASQDDGDCDMEEQDDQPFSFNSVDKDPRLAKLALHAARSFHQLQGVKYDESGVKIDMYSDVKISVLELKMPLGLIFMENDGGCFVTKVSPDGSAARSGGVEVGDQLAAIAGNSNMKMKVDDICTMISSSPDPTCVELVFLRYIGPFRPFKYSPKFDSTPQNLSPARNAKVLPNQPAKESPGKNKKGFRWFGRGKNKGVKGK